MLTYYPGQGSYATATQAIERESEWPENYYFDHAGGASVEYVPGLGSTYSVYPTCRSCDRDWEYHWRRDEDCPAIGPQHVVFVRAIDKRME